MCVLEGRKHDAGMLADSGLLRDLEQFAFNPTGHPLCVYDDPAYPLRIHLQGPLKYGALTPQMEAYNGKMSAIRSSVEWLSGDIIYSFKFNDFKKIENLFKQCWENVCGFCHTSKCIDLFVGKPDLNVC